MKKKVWIIIGIIAIVAAAALIVPRLLGGSHNGIDNEPEANVAGNSKILVAYFSWSGNGQQMARWIAEETGGELFRIVPAESYGEDYGACADRAKNELDNGIRPELSSHIDADIMAQYDTIYLGFPIWWYDLPTPVWTFLEEYDLSGKTIIPFFSHNGSSNGANSLNRLSELAEGAAVLTDEVLSIPGSSVADSEEEVKEWAANELNETPADSTSANSETENSGSAETTNPAETDESDMPTEGKTVEAPGSGPADVSNIASVEGVPLITLNNGVQKPQFGLGTQIQSLENGDLGVLNQTSRESVAAALGAGYRHLDDAHGYLQERGVGQGIIDSGVPREEIWITDKLWPSEYGDAYNAINQMLDRLGVEYLDLVYLHHPAGDIDTIVAAWQDMEQAYREGKIRALGISNFDNRMDAFNAIMEQEIKPQIMQIECHPFAQRQETRELAEQYDIQVECWYPLGHGDQRLLNAETLEAIAAAHDKSVVQIIIRWHIQEGFSVIPGSTNPDHIQENIEIFDFELTDEEMEQIRAMDQGEAGRYFNLNYDMMGGMFTNPPREWDGEF